MKPQKSQSKFPFSVGVVDENEQSVDLVSALSSQYSNRDDWMDSGDLAQGAHMIAGDRADVSTVVPIFGDQSQEILQSNIETMREDALKGRSTLMPIHQNGNHYTAGFMTSSVGEDGHRKLHFLYNDSFGNEMPKELRAALGEGVEIIDMRISQQQNDFECGNHALANMQSFLDSGFGTEGFDPKVLEEEMKKKKKLKFSDENKESLTEILPSELPQEKAKEAVFNKTFEDLLGEDYEERIKRNKDGSIASIGCASAEEAGKVSSGMKKFCDDIGLPCEVVDKGNGCYMVGVKMPPEFRGRDPFSMKADELDHLKEVLATQKAAEEEKLKGSDGNSDMQQAMKEAGGVIKTLQDHGAGNLFDKGDADRDQPRAPAISGAKETGGTTR